MRLAATADELASCARAAREDDVRTGVRAQLAQLAEEVRATVADADAELEQEFRRVVSPASPDVPAEVHAAALVGWLKGTLGTQALDEKREGEVAQRAAPRGRKHTLGFKLRSPVTREPAAADAERAAPDAGS